MADDRLERRQRDSAILLEERSHMKSAFELENQNTSIDSRIVAALERISEAFRVLLWNESKEFSLSPIQIQVLIFLHTHTEDKRRISYLADEFNMTRPTLSDVVKVLEEKALIKKTPDSKDARSHRIALTRKGKEIAGRTSLFAHELEKPIGVLHPDDKENLLLSLMGIIYHLTEVGVITVQRMCMTCTHYANDPSRGGHFCMLLNKKLQNSELRIDCPEHAPVAE